MMSKLRCSVSVAALALATGLVVSPPATAADLPLKARPMVPPAPVAVSWHGFYVGVHAGWGGADHGGSFRDGDSAVFGSGLDLNGALVGFQAGYNWDLGRWIVGIEGDISFMRWHGNSFAAGSSDFATGTIDNLGSIRARIGIPVTNDRRGLLYITGGAAWANAEVTAYNGPVDDSTPQKIDFDDIGGVIGGGFEWAMTPQLRARIEGLYYIFDDSVRVTSPPGDSPADHLSLDSIWTVRGGINWYFNSPR